MVLSQLGLRDSLTGYVVYESASNPGNGSTAGPIDADATDTPLPLPILSLMAIAEMYFRYHVGDVEIYDVITVLISHQMSQNASSGNVAGEGMRMHVKTDIC